MAPQLEMHLGNGLHRDWQEVCYDHLSLEIELTGGPSLYWLQEGYFRSDPVEFQFDIRTFNPQEHFRFHIICIISNLGRAIKIGHEQNKLHDLTCVYKSVSPNYEWMVTQALSRIGLELLTGSEIKIHGYDPDKRSFTGVEIPFIESTPF